MIISFVSMKGGVGKSTLARTAAIELKKAGFDMLLADLDPKQGTSEEWSERRLERDEKHHVETIRYRRPEEAEFGDSKHDHIIVDARPYDQILLRKLAIISDIMILPSGPSRDDTNPTIRLYNLLRRQKASTAITRILINNVGSDFETARARMLFDLAHCEVMTSTMPGRISYRSALDSGLVLTETFRGYLHERANDVVNELLGLIELASGGVDKAEVVAANA